MAFQSFTGVSYNDLISSQEFLPVYKNYIQLYNRYVPFLSLIGMDSEPILAHQQYFYEDQAITDSYELSATFDNDDTAITVTSTVGLKEGDQLVYGTDIFDNTKEILYVEDVLNSTTLTVRRGFGTTTGATLTSGQKLTWITQSVPVAASEVKTSRTAKVNKPISLQRFRQDVLVERESLPPIEKSPREAMALMAELMNTEYFNALKALENAILNGVDGGYGLGNTTDPSTIKGILRRITNIYTDTMSIENINNFVATLDGFGYNARQAIADVNATVNGLPTNPKGWVLIAGNKAFSAMNKLDANYFTKSPLDSYIGVSPAKKVYTDYGELPIYPMKEIPTNYILLLRTDFVKIANLQGFAFKYNQGTFNRDIVGGWWGGTYGMKFYHDNAHAVWNVPGL